MSSSPQNEAEAREKMRELMSRPPSSRPADFVNPLEKIEQLLTCPICLDRYKQPKLLPCQHTFCYPCLESCADTLHRNLKCPECRAEHNIPYDGVKAFQPNYTLTGFLEIHLQATPESAAEIEEYIHRYNLERCKICDEKADCEPCAHCDRKACKECRQTHMDMLKRDMSRLLNQVKRLANRITEASDNLSKGVDMMTMNCETTKAEIKEYFHRYQRDLKKKEDNFLMEVDTFQATETRNMSNLRDVLEIESSNMSEAVSRLDAAIKGECSIEDSELVRMKNTFTEGLEYLRNFQPDADELFNRKLRFSAGDDAAKLPAAITTSGELCVLVPQFSGRYLPLEQSYLPRPFRLPLESDSYRVKSDERASMRDREADRTSSRHSHRNPEPDESSIRYRRRQQLEDEAWNRLRNSSAAPSLLTTSVTADSSSRTSPWAADRVTRSVEPTKSRPTSLIVPNTETPRTVSPASKPPLPPQSVERVERTEDASPAPLPQLPIRKPPLPRQQSSNDDSLNEKVETIRRAHQQRQDASRAASRAVSSEESEGEDFPVSTNRGRIRIVCRAASVNRDDGLMSMIPGTGTIINVPPPQHQLPASAPITNGTSEQVAIPVTHFTDSSTTTDEEKEKLAVLRQRGRSASREAGEWRARGRPRAVFGRKGAKDGELNWPRGICALSGGLVATCDSSNHRVCVFDKDGKFVRQFGGYGAGAGQLDSAAGLASSKLRVIVSDRYNHRISVFGLEGDHLFSFGGHGQGNAKFNNPWGVAVDDLGSIYVADKDNHRVQVFDKNGQFIAKFGSFGHLPGQLNSPLFIAVSRVTHHVYVSDSSNHRISVFDPHGVHLFSFGEEGFHGGQFKFPRGIAIDSQENLIIADSGNNRIQVFDAQGQFVSSFGTWGGGAGQLKGVEDVCVTADGSIVVTDRENHRIQIF
ncbi:RING-type domain-containing protein [Caenorhabditis elegans]|uniref:RING-type domain-containing protein n=1 Tax=Caenorhabditis elegans TaxID=6239 RepID=A0A131MCD3_CAEEL|nr:RING-type domain-containing protein [Caenorhabditis elegans]CZR14501.1 RING-type domain-containing protein [Caenorhabditis elegans]|eukprot:NP_001309582.1 RING finger protein nhl-1 [Caenorhabditis elegans]